MCLSKAQINVLKIRQHQEILYLAIVLNLNACFFSQMPQQHFSPSFSLIWYIKITKTKTNIYKWKL